MLERFGGLGCVSLSDLGRVDEAELRHLLHWIGRAYETPRDASGARSADSSDGRVRIVLRPPPSGRDPIVLHAPQGRFTTADYGIEVGRL
jgi:hypothetical protein